MQYLVEPEDQNNPRLPLETRKIFIAKQFPQFQINQIVQPTTRQRCSSCREFVQLTPEHTRRCELEQKRLDRQFIKESNEFDNIIHTRLYGVNEQFRQYIRRERLFKRTLVVPEVVRRIKKRVDRAIREECEIDTRYTDTERLMQRLERARLAVLEKEKAAKAEWCIKAKALYQKRIKALDKSPTCIPVLGCNAKTGAILFYPTKPNN